jgi:hypothetical protein
MTETEEQIDAKIKIAEAKECTAKLTAAIDAMTDVVKLNSELLKALNASLVNKTVKNFIELLEEKQRMETDIG